MIAFSPAFSLYNTNIEMYGGKPVLYDMVQNEMKINKEKLSELITSKTKAILINSPCNPTGKVFSKEENLIRYE